MLSGCHFLGYTALTVRTAALPMLFISVVCATVELLSAPLSKVVGEFADDNLTVPFVAALLSVLLLRG